MLKVKSILVSQPDPGDKKTAYHILAEKYKLKLDFRPFIQVEPVPGKELRKNRINILDHSAIILTSKNAVDNFFRCAEELRVDLPITMKYFCANEGISLYTQKYIQLRKRKMFFGKGRDPEFLKLLKTHSKENFLFPCSNIRSELIPSFLTENKINFKEAVMYNTVNADLSDLENVFYDIIVFFSPADIKSLFDNFPNFKQNKTRIAGWGETTNQAIEEAKLVNDIPAPTPVSPSMTAAIEEYIKTIPNQ
ncbi:MAG: uroporphyrinogen-III synthase [Flavobacteriales bacterium]|nr:uroporphyrinogen-III synthase [Flavobacteriales bacterium]